VVSVPSNEPSNRTSTRSMATSSWAVTEIVTVPETVAVS